MQRIAYLWISGWLALCACAAQAQETALDRYVAKPDPNYSYTVVDTDDDVLYETYHIDMTSQQWRTTAEVDRPLWQHAMAVVVPTVPFAEPGKTAILLIDGGDNDDDGRVDDDIVNSLGAVAVSLNAIVAVVKQVPNQPLNFTDEVNNPRTEDAVITYSFDKYLDTGDEEWPVLLPMTKAAVRAMDTVQAIADQAGEEVDDFIVIGGSKRGWTTWLTAAVDSRVRGIVPISFDALNLDEQFRHHFEVYGFYTPALADYVEFDIPCRIQTSAGQELLRIVDPFEYRARFTMPKFIINSSGDQFFVSDSTRFYYDQLPEPKTLRYTFNTDHAQGDYVNLLTQTLLWMEDVQEGNNPPDYDWSIAPDGTIRVQAFDTPDRVFLWQATNPTARDFRLETLGAQWTRSELAGQGNGVYVATQAAPSQGYTGFAVELVYDEDRLLGTVNASLKYTSGISVVPDSLPFQGQSCQGVTQPTTPDGVGLYRPEAGQFYLKTANSSGNADLSIPLGPLNSNWLPVVGDWNGDGITTVGQYDPAASVFYLYDSNVVTAPTTSIPYGAPGAGWLPIAGDWDGDGVDSLGLYDPLQAVFYLRNSNSAGFADVVFPYGAPGAGWIPLAGDWDGDGVDTVGLYDPLRSLLLLSNTNTAGFAAIVFPYGPPNGGWKPLAGDWNGDGVDTIGLYLPDGRFALRNSNDAGFADIVLSFTPNDPIWQPVAGRWR